MTHKVFVKPTKILIIEIDDPEYRGELFESESADDRNRTIKNHGQKFTLRLIQEVARRDGVTLLCHCDEEEQHCHRHLLAAILRRKI